MTVSHLQGDDDMRKKMPASIRHTETENCNNANFVIIGG